MRPVLCVSCGGPKESQRGFCCDRCRAPWQRAAWARRKRRLRWVRSNASSTPPSSPVEPGNHRYVGGAVR